MDIDDVKFCRLKPGLLCQEHFCNRCYIWLKWDYVLQEAQREIAMREKNKGENQSGPALI